MNNINNASEAQIVINKLTSQVMQKIVSIMKDKKTFVFNTEVNFTYYEEVMKEINLAGSKVVIVSETREGIEQEYEITHEAISINDLIYILSEIE